MSGVRQLFLLADHIRLSLLERQRASTLDARIDSEDGHISRSLDQFRSGLASLEKQKLQYEVEGNEQQAETLNDSLADLRQQLDVLSHEFCGPSAVPTERIPDEPNSNQVIDDDLSLPSSRRSKAVRFNDTTPSTTREFLGTYRDDPSNYSAGYRDQASEMTNSQLHQYHHQILEEQDEQLDRLGESIGRQREISMQIGDELDSHVAILDEMETVVDRHQSRLDRAKNILERVAKGAGENKQMTAIVVLIIVLVLLIAIFK